ncbi:MAG: cyclic nucleotide-binding domain-containing protein, partial [Spirochaetota bacterium]|nr:cyclic nucleotide-binding domain-containing protein [Spirochaetota bacterium]
MRKFEKTYQAGEVIFNEGDATNEMYFVLEGEVRIIKMVHEEIKELAVLGKGEFFGEMSTFTGQ